MVRNQFLAHLFFIIIQKTKFEIIDFFFIIEIYFIENQSVIWQSQIDAHLTHAQNKFSKLQRAIKVLIEPSERFSEPFEFLDDPVVDMLEQHVNPSILLCGFHHRQSFQ